MYLEKMYFRVITTKYDFNTYFHIRKCIHMSYFVILLKMLEYAIVFILTSMSKYAYKRYHRIYTEIRSYLEDSSLVQFTSFLMVMSRADNSPSR